MQDRQPAKLFLQKRDGMAHTSLVRLLEVQWDSASAET